MSEPWTRQEQINYAVFHSKEAPPEWEAALNAIHRLALATKMKSAPGHTIYTHFNKLLDAYNDASMSVD